MGTDDLFHKRKARKAESLQRRQAKRAPYDVVLIVCEGSKTEPNYFRGLKDSLRLSNANIVIADNTIGSDPLSVVNSAIKEFNKDPSYDKVYCVFDKDKHTTYASALDKIKSNPFKKRVLYMRTFAEAWPDEEFVQQVVGQIPWGHNIVLLSKVKSRDEREWYIRKAIEQSRYRKN